MYSNALRRQARTDRDQLLGLAVEHRGLVGLLVELEVDLAEARLDHRVGSRLWAGLALVLFGEGLVTMVLRVAHFRVAHFACLVSRAASPGWWVATRASAPFSAAFSTTAAASE